MGVFDRFTSEKKGGEIDVQPEVYETQDFGEGVVSDNADNLHRRLGNRQIQLLAIGGSIGKSFVPSCLACDRRRYDGMSLGSVRSPLYYYRLCHYIVLRTLKA